MKHVTVDLAGMTFALRIAENGTYKAADFALDEEVILDTFLGPTRARVISISQRYVDAVILRDQKAVAYTNVTDDDWVMADE